MDQTSVAESRRERVKINLGRQQISGRAILINE